MKNKIPALILISAFILVGIGVFRGEAQVVLTKGVNLCLECVGIG